jgi:hypothetical protein
MGGGGWYYFTKQQQEQNGREGGTHYMQLVREQLKRTIPLA